MKRKASHSSAEGEGGEVTVQRVMEEKGRAHAEQGEELGLEGSQHTLHLNS
jgi:hypothetical protein